MQTTTIITVLIAAIVPNVITTVITFLVVHIILLYATPKPSRSPAVAYLALSIRFKISGFSRFT